MSLAMVATSWLIYDRSTFAAVAAQSNEVLWYLTRMTAVSAYIVLTVSALLGMVRGVARGTGKHLSWITDELHQVLATTFGGLVLLHLVTLYYHTFIPFSLVNFLVPGHQPYRPLAVNLGVLGLYGLVVVLVSSWLRRRISYRTWRRVHYVSFVTFLLVTLHGLLAGSDAGEPWMRAVYIGASAAVGFLALLRLLTSLRREPAAAVSQPERELTRAPDTTQARSPRVQWQRIEQLQAMQQANPGWDRLRREITARQKLLPPAQRTRR
jgi:methionine sulfoxide reductase heme-binding subunit